MAAIISTVLMACKQNETPVSAAIHVKLTDAPGNYTAVNIDLEQVQVKPANGTWLDITTNAGSYDLIQLTNGVDTLIVADSLPSGIQIQQIRLVLGSNNTVVVDSITYPLEVPSGEQTGLKLNLNRLMIQDSLNTVLLDFDAEKSIVATGNGKYLLKPVIKVVD